MVLRPHILKYKNKLKKIDKDKMDRIRAAQSPAGQVQDLKIMPRMSVVIYGAAAIVVSAPFLYIIYEIYLN